MTEDEMTGLLRSALSSTPDEASRLRARLRAVVLAEQAESNDRAIWADFGRIMVRAGRTMQLFTPALVAPRGAYYRSHP